MSSPEPTNVTVTLRSGGRSFCEEIDLAAQRSYFERLCSNGANPALDDVSFAQWVREVSVAGNQLDALAGDHFVFGWFESLSQSDASPDFLYTDGLDRLEVNWT